MAKRYVLWDKTSSVRTPSFEVFTAEEWKNRHPIAKEEDSVIVLANSYFNGGLIAELHQLIEIAESRGATFAEGLSDQELLDAIEQFEEEYAAAQQAAAEEAAAKELDYAAASLKAEQDVAGALTYQNMMNY